MTNETDPPTDVGSTAGLGPLPEPGMQEVNPYLDLGPMDPHGGKQVLAWYSPDALRAYAAAAVAAESEKWQEELQAKREALRRASGWLHAAYDRPPQTPECLAMLAEIDAARDLGA